MNIVDEIIHHLNHNVKTKIGVSKIHGVGVFSIRDIKKGEEVFSTWKLSSGIYIIPNERLNEISKEVLELLDMYFINDECGFKFIRLFKDLNFLFNGVSFCNSAYPNKQNINIDNKGVALRDIKAGEEILEWYTENINK
jgi:SET domain-containing protein